MKEKPIDASVLLKDLDEVANEYRVNGSSYCAAVAERCRHIVRHSVKVAASAIDPVRHAGWTEYDGCSACGEPKPCDYHGSSYESDFYQGCGSRMDGGAV
jgi:hypothetical protein